MTQGLDAKAIFCYYLGPIRHACYCSLLILLFDSLTLYIYNIRNRQILQEEAYYTKILY